MNVITLRTWIAIMTLIHVALTADYVDYFEFGKKWYLITPPLEPNLKKNWNVDYFDIFVPPLILVKTVQNPLTLAKTLPKSYLTVTMELLQSYFSHICTKSCLYLPFISPIYYQNQDHISVIWIWLGEHEKTMKIWTYVKIVGK